MAPASGIPVGKLVYTVFNSILEVFLMCFAGYILARMNILDKKTQKKLNHLNVYLFTPALVFSKVAFFLTPQKLLSLWIIPISFIIITVVSLLISLLISLPFKLKRSQRNFAIAASMFMNSNSLPIALMQSLVGSVQGLKWEGNGEGEDNKDAMMGRALTYLVVASTMGMILRWSFGVRLLAAADDINATPKPKTSDNVPPAPSRSPSSDQILLVSPTTTVFSLTPAPSRSPSLEKLPSPSSPTSDTHLRPPMSCYRSFPNSPNQSTDNLPSLHVACQKESAVTFVDVKTEDAGLPSPVQESTTPSRPASLPRRCLRSVIRGLRSFWNAISSMLTPPLIASLVSLVVALITPVQHFLLKEELKPVRGFLEKAGAVSIPLTLIVLGGYFVPESKDGAQKQKGSETNGAEVSRSQRLVGSVKGLFTRRRNTKGKARQVDEESAGAASSTEKTAGESCQQAANDAPSISQPEKENDKASRRGETATVIISIVSRMILAPAVLMPLVVWIATSDWAGVFDDPIFILSLLLLLCSPPALTLAQITQAASGDAFERLIGRTIFWSYLVMTPIVMVGVVVGGVILTRV